MLAWRIDASYGYRMQAKGEESLRTYIAATFFVLCALMPIAARADATTSATSSSATTTIVHTNVGIEDKVKAAFPDAPVMVNVAQCESLFRQFTDTGSVFYGGLNKNMVGIFQLYSSVHRTIALSLGFDITTVDGNIGYARHLYDTQGTDPWLDSFSCWNPGTAESAASSTVAVLSEDASSLKMLTVDMSLGKINPQVKTLQKMLNAMGYTIAKKGPGSLGEETTKYGASTRVAVRTFQCAEHIACSGSEGTTGYGFVGERTRAALTLAYEGKRDKPEAIAQTASVATAVLH